jgi:hypothetical protein
MSFCWSAERVLVLEDMLKECCAVRVFQSVGL